MARVLKFWHQWSWLITCGGYIFLIGMTYANYKNALAAIQEAQTIEIVQHDKENLDHRVTILEQIAADNRDNFSEIKDTERAIFQRIDQISDGKR